MNAPTSPASGVDGGVGPLKAMAARQQRPPAGRRPRLRARLARVEIELANMRTTNLRVVAAVAARAGAESSMLKIRGTQIRQEITALNRRAMGLCPGRRRRHGADTPIGPDGADTPRRNTNNRKLSIFGGSNEIRKHHRQDDPGTVRPAMNFEHTEDRRMLSDMLRAFAEQYDIATRHRNAGAERGHSPEFWRRYAELGAIGAVRRARRQAAPVSTSPWCSRRWGAAW